MKNNNNIILILIIVTLLTIPASNFSILYAKKTKSDVNKYLDKLELKILKIQGDSIVSHSKDILDKINEYVEKAKDNRDRRKYEKAYYMAKIAEEYIELIKARIRLEDAMIEFRKARQAAKSSKKTSTKEKEDTSAEMEKPLKKDTKDDSSGMPSFLEKVDD